MAILSAIIHGNGPRGEQVALAALDGTRELDGEKARLYIDIVLSSLGETARATLEALMEARDYEYRSDFARRYVAEGRAEGHEEGREEGLAEGRADGLARALLTVLAARGFAVDDPVRAEVRQCTDPEALEAWLGRAATATSLREVFGE